MNSTTTRWTDDALERMRKVMDPPADKVAEELFKLNDFRDAVRLLDFMSRNDSSVDLSFKGFELPQALKDYFNDTSHFKFTKEEKATLDRAADIFELYGPFITIILAVRSLIKQYAATKSTNVLRLTTLLEKHTDRRITETFQFVLDVMQKGWYLPGKRGIRSIQKLRLIHALIRFRIKHGLYDQAQGPWNDDWGQPINQEDIIFANQTFSVEVIQGLEQGGFRLSDEQKEDYMKAWILIGKALGVDPALEPASYTEGAALQQQIYKRQFVPPNHNGPPLAQAMIKFLMDMAPFDVSEKSIITIIKYFEGVENYPVLRDILKIDIGNSHHNLAMHAHQELKAVEDHELHQGIATMTPADLAAGNYPEPLRNEIIEIFMNKLLRAVFAHKRGSKSTSFQIDDALAEKWGVPGNEGIPAPIEPDIDGPKGKHPLLKFFYNIGIWILGLVVKVREFFKGGGGS